MSFLIDSPGVHVTFAEKTKFTRDETTNVVYTPSTSTIDHATNTGSESASEGRIRKDTSGYHPQRNSQTTYSTSDVCNIN